MLNFSYYSPTRFVFGEDSEAQVGDLCRQLGAQTVLVHYGGGSVVRSGLLERVMHALQAAGLAVELLGGVVPNPRDDLVYAGIEQCRRQGVDLVLGIGGGSAIDSAKAIALGTPYDGDFWDFYTQKALPEKRLLLGTIITHPATGTDGSNSSVILKSDQQLKRGLRSDFNRPDFSIINPIWTKSLPPYQLACGIVDILSHVFERYFTRTPNVTVSDHLCEAVMRAVVEVGLKAWEDENDMAARGNLMWAATLAHVGLLGMGRQEDWGVHALQHELSAHTDMAHGAGLAALYPAWMQFHLSADPARFARLARSVFDVDPTGLSELEQGRQGILQLAALYRTLGMPVSLQELDVRKEDLPALARKVKRNPDGSCGHYLPLQDADVLSVYQLSYDWSAHSL